MGGLRKSMKEKSINTTVDLVKLIMAFLVVCIHTEPFGFNFWLDKGFGIVTRLCVPFFFVSSAYFCWKTTELSKQ
ncbi:acyltransferase family protein [[Clostridium] aminophilum]|uniref:acyltransferase family protein n=1 Tax=[Clostridium] aminophilum TaxID=1526 RepID=UPI003B513EC1